MIVLLVRPKAPNVFRFSKLVENEPIELEYLMTVLNAHGHQATIYDGVFDKRPIKRVIRKLEPDLVAITGYITQENAMKEVAKKVKQVNPQVMTVVGGVHAQLNPETFKTPDVDFIFRSASMSFFSDLIEAIAKPYDLKTLSQIDGLVFRDFSDSSAPVWRANGLAPCDINLLPVPDRTHYYWNRYHYRFLKLREVATMKTAFSCPQSCSFCYCKKLNGGKYQTRDLDLVMQELSAMTAEAVQIVDDDFLADISRAWAFVERVKTAGIRKTYTCYARADAVAANPELIAALKAIGFRYFIVGLEAVDDAILMDYQKQTTEEINRRCVQTIKSVGAECIALMMISHTAVKADFDAIYSWAKASGLTYTTVSIFTPIPGTPLYEDFASQITSKKIEHWDFLHLVLKPTNLSKPMFTYYYIKLTLKLILLSIGSSTNETEQIFSFRN